MNPNTSPEAPEMRELQFRCSKTGVRFKAVFARFSASHKFRVVRLLPEPAEHTEERSVGRRLLTKLLGPSQTKRDASQSPDGLPRQSQTFNRDDFDFSGWHCLICGTAEKRFILCSECDECVCGARIARVDDATETYECWDGCTGGGVLNEKISTFRGAALGAPAASAQLACSRSAKIEGKTTRKLAGRGQRDGTPPGLENRQ